MKKLISSSLVVAILACMSPVHGIDICRFGGDSFKDMDNGTFITSAPELADCNGKLNTERLKVPFVPPFIPAYTFFKELGEYNGFVFPIFGNIGRSFTKTKIGSIKKFTDEDIKNYSAIQEELSVLLNQLKKSEDDLKINSDKKSLINKLKNKLISYYDATNFPFSSDLALRLDDKEIFSFESENSTLVGPSFSAGLLGHENLFDIVPLSSSILGLSFYYRGNRKVSVRKLSDTIVQVKTTLKKVLNGAGHIGGGSLVNQVYLGDLAVDTKVDIGLKTTLLLSGKDISPVTAFISKENNKATIFLHEFDLSTFKGRELYEKTVGGDLKALEAFLSDNPSSKSVKQLYSSLRQSNKLRNGFGIQVPFVDLLSQCKNGRVEVQRKQGHRYMIEESNGVECGQHSTGSLIKYFSGVSKSYQNAWMSRIDLNGRKHEGFFVSLERNFEKDVLLGGLIKRNRTKDTLDYFSSVFSFLRDDIKAFVTREKDELRGASLSLKGDFFFPKESLDKIIKRLSLSEYELKMKLIEVLRYKGKILNTRFDQSDDCGDLSFGPYFFVDCTTKDVFNGQVSLFKKLISKEKSGADVTNLFLNLFRSPETFEAFLGLVNQTAELKNLVTTLEYNLDIKVNDKHFLVLKSKNRNILSLSEYTKYKPQLDAMMLTSHVDEGFVTTSSISNADLNLGIDELDRLINKDERVYPVSCDCEISDGLDTFVVTNGLKLFDIGGDKKISYKAFKRAHGYCYEKAKQSNNPEYERVQFTRIKNCKKDLNDLTKDRIVRKKIEKQVWTLVLKFKERLVSQRDDKCSKYLIFKNQNTIVKAMLGGTLAAIGNAIRGGGYRHRPVAGKIPTAVGMVLGYALGSYIGANSCEQLVAGMQASLVSVIGEAWGWGEIFDIGRWDGNEIPDLFAMNARGSYLSAWSNAILQEGGIDVSQEFTGDSLGLVYGLGWYMFEEQRKVLEFVADKLRHDAGNPGPMRFAELTYGFTNMSQIIFHMAKSNNEKSNELDKRIEELNRIITGRSSQ